ncbi:MAG: enoyl-CoA hydratase/isomerase family protein [Alphaproteobacteria bacterium]|jgi:enoyl-CoA hydratase|nr:enoyl-CoA hydratase/isomerase family protein [Alphaproteobacteria bacterium]
MSDIIITVENSTGRIHLNRPKALNALTYEMNDALEEALLSWADDAAITQIVITAEGEKSFCAGGDVAELYRRGVDGDHDYARSYWRDEYRLNALIEAYPKPYIALMQGYVLGGGVGVSCHGSHRITSQTSRFAMPECAIGLMPDVGGSMLLARAPGYLGEYLGTTGARMKAGDAIFAGFADYFVLQEKWPALLKALIATGTPDCIADFESPVLDDLLPIFAKRDEINSLFSAENPHDVVRAIAHQTTPLAAEINQAYSRQSPLSVLSTITSIRAVRLSPDMETAIDYEFRFTARSLSDADFLEGVRAMLIDKDHAPNWKYKTFDDVSDDIIAHMLAPLDAPA